MKRYYIRVTGWVQGVGFRYFVKHTAGLHGLTGWVRNRGDGGVELEVQGDGSVLAGFIEAVGRGNRYSQVEDLQIKQLEPIREHCFEIVD